uniref:AlNc14C18G1903 protein n=1 Tax=Albugo laibachii Nc14 TaxID=890382 RepID=F0W4T5_9STRA|nr:AlNc14C18G1903 [Albugo laibachii Nc14]|eukprot:CCA16121.1 AlNc14C18G1903 [Albugo laibachii Nc14]
MEDVPRAKRLRLLREAKERKEKKESKESKESNPVNEKEDTVQDYDKHSPKFQPPIETESKEERKVVISENEHTDKDDDDDVLLAPKRANWDIERDLAPMMKKLERRTQRAVVEILREKIAREQQEDCNRD